MKEILEYQQLEIEINKMRKNASESEEKAVMAQMANYVKEAQNKSGKLEMEAEKLVKEYKELKNNYNKITAEVNKLIGVEASKLSQDELNARFGQVNKLSSDLFMLERKLNFIITNSKNLLKNFEITRNNVKKAKQKHKEAREKLENNKQQLEPKFVEMQKKLADLEKKIDKELMAKYKALKGDGIFPVFVPLMGESCGGCRMNIPTGKLAKITEKGYIVCEHCGRIIYKK